MSSGPLLEEGREEESMMVAQYIAPRLRRLSSLRLRGGEGQEAMFVGGGFCCVIVFMCMIVTTFTSVVKPNHVGIAYNSLTKHSDLTQSFPPGRHWASPAQTYILFPTTLQNVHLEMISRTNEGFPITLIVTVQYYLMKDKVIEIYKEFNVKYEQVYVRNVRDALMRTISEYSAQDFYQKRKDILREMTKLLTDRLDSAFAHVWDIQFNDVKQSQGFEDSLIRAQLQNWFAKTKKQEQAVSAVKARTAVIKAQFDKNISFINSTATSDCSYITSTASAQASIYTQEADANATLILDQANAIGTVIVQEATAKAELVYQAAVAEGNSHVLEEKAHADQRSTQLQGLQLKYWTEIVGLSKPGLVAFQKLVGQAYKQLEDVTFLFGFKNTYATADVGKLSQNDVSAAPTAPAPAQLLLAPAPSMAQAVELAAITGNAAGAAAATQESKALPPTAASSAAVLPTAAPQRVLSDDEGDGTEAMRVRLAHAFPEELRMNSLKMPQWTELEL